MIQNYEGTSPPLFILREQLQSIFCRRRMSARYPLRNGSPLNLPNIWPIPNLERIEEQEIIAQESEESEDREESEPIPANMAAIEWKTDPYYGNFKPGTPLGHKIFLEKTKGLKIEK